MSINVTSKLRLISLVIGVAFVLCALSLNPQGTLGKIGAAVGAAFLTWITTIWADSYKTKASILATHHAALMANIEKIDACLFKLRTMNKSVQGGLGMLWAGQTLEEWNANASEAWNEIHSTMEELTKALWHQRAFLADFDQLEQDINNLSFSLKGMIGIHSASHNKQGGGFDTESYIAKSEAVNALIPALDKRLRTERLKILNDSLSI
jgi:hypothetical protein